MTQKKFTPAANPKAQIRDWEVVSAEEPEPAAKAPTTHTVAEGQNIQTVAQIHLPEGWSRNEYASHLAKTNSSFAVGRVINLA